jgi:hypothetical protein
VTEAAVYFRPEDADARLWRLARLQRQDLMESVIAAVVAVGACTENDPPTARGYDAWRFALRRLREVLRPQGWEKDDTGNFSTVVSHPARVRIAVVNTDDATGNPRIYPTNRSRKGANADRASQINQFVLPFPNWVELEPEEAAIPGYATWYLCINVGGHQVRAELSLPTRMEGGYFADWNERIILVSSDGGWSVGPDMPEGGDDDGPVFEVPISRR